MSDRVRSCFSHWGSARPPADPGLKARKQDRMAPRRTAPVSTARRRWRTRLLRRPWMRPRDSIRLRTRVRPATRRQHWTRIPPHPTLRPAVPRAARRATSSWIGTYPPQAFPARAAAIASPIRARTGERPVGWGSPARPITTAPNAAVGSAQRFTVMSADRKGAYNPRGSLADLTPCGSRFRQTRKTLARHSR